MQRDCQLAKRLSEAAGAFLWKGQLQDGSRVKSELPLLGVLLDWCGRLISRNLHFGTCFLGDLANEVVKTIAGLQWDVMPWGDLR